MIHVSGPYRCAKFGANRLRGASVRMGEIYLYFFRELIPTGQTHRRVFTTDG